MTWITIQLTNLQVRAYPSRDAATADTLQLNRQSPDHPAFHLWNISRGTSTYHGRLHRPFGQDFNERNPWLKDMPHG